MAVDSLSTGADAPRGGWRSDAASWLRERRVDLLIVAAVWVATSIVIYLLAIGHVVPMRYLDEFLYWAMAKSQAAGDGLTWRGVPTSLWSSLYPRMIAPAFDMADTVKGQYRAVHAINSVMISAVVFPAFLMARLFVGRKLALLAVAFAIAAPAMNYAGLIAQENLAYPVCTAAFGACLLALVRPLGRNAVLAFLLLGIAAFTRIQFVLLLPVFIAAFALVVLMREPGTKREYLRAQKVLCGLFGAAVVLGLIAVLIKGQSLVGVHIGVFKGKHLTFGNAWFWTKGFLADVYLVAAIVPVFATFAMFGDRENRRDPLVGPLLAISLVAALAFVAQVAWFSATSPFDWRTAHVFYERYMFYLAPLFFTGLVVSFGRVRPKAATASVLIGVLIVSGMQSDLVKVPFSYDSFGLNYVGFLMDAHDSWLPHIGMLLAGLAAILGILYVLGTLPERHAEARRLGRALSVGIALFVLVISQAKSWDYARLYSGDGLTRAAKPVDFVDANTDREVGMVVTEANDPTSFYQLEFWNNRITSMWVNRAAPLRSPVTYSPSCQFNWDSTGRILPDDYCPKVPSAWYFGSPNLVMHMRDEIERVEQSPRLRGNTLTVVRPPSRLFSFVDGIVVKTRIAEQGKVAVWTFFDEPGSVRVALPGGRVIEREVGSGQHVTNFAIAGSKPKVKSVSAREGGGPWRPIG